MALEMVVVMPMFYNLRLEDAKKMRQSQLKVGVPSLSKYDAATFIQKVSTHNIYHVYSGLVCAVKLMACLMCLQVWRGYGQRKKLQSMREEELLFLGMVCISISSISSTCVCI